GACGRLRLGDSPDIEPRHTIAKARQREMRIEIIRRHCRVTQPGAKLAMQRTQAGKALSDAKPEDARRAAARKKSETVERQTERRDRKRRGERRHHALLNRVAGVAKKLDREMEPIGVH